jgi:hypothetical protein
MFGVLAPLGDRAEKRGMAVSFVLQSATQNAPYLDSEESTEVAAVSTQTGAGHGRTIPLFIWIC